MTVTKLLARVVGEQDWRHAKAELYDVRYYAEVPEIMLHGDAMACDFDLLLVLNSGFRQIKRSNVEVCSLDEWLVGFTRTK